MKNVHQPASPPARWSPQLLSEIASAPDLATAAEHLGASAIPVFPCVPGGKRPLTPHGFQDASADLGVIDSWWRRQPDANIGVPTGAAGGIDVVDVDVHETGSGYAAFEHARRAGFVEGWAWMVRTPSGGLHAYFLRTDQRQQRSWQVPGKHIDFRGDGGYIIVPPSQVTGDDGISRSYQQIAVAEDRRPGPVDATGLRGFLDPPRPMRPPPDLPAVGARPDKLAAWVASRPEGARNGGVVLGGVSDGRGRPRSQQYDVAARRGGVHRGPAGAGSAGDDQVGLPDREAARSGDRSAPYECG